LHEACHYQLSIEYCSALSRSSPVSGDSNIEATHQKGSLFHRHNRHRRRTSIVFWVPA
jgi:hypothetical protein